MATAIKAFGMLAVSIVLSSTAAAAGADVADFYRGKTLRILVGYGPGTGYDVYAPCWRGIFPSTSPASPAWSFRTCRARPA